jgi:putative ABC transport system ATP-binding protein
MRVEVAALEHTYAAHGLEDRTVLRIDGWDAGSGSRWLLHGVSGSGKTTLLNVLAGLLPPTRGQVRLDGQAIYDESESDRDMRRASDIGYVYQVQLLIPILSALENVEMPLVYGHGLDAAGRRDRALEMLARVGMADFAAHRPVQLSMGQRLRVAVARAMAVEPRLILADEPTASLDPEGACGVMESLLDYSREHSATLLVASHDPALDVHFEHRLSLVEGHLVEAGPVGGTGVAVGSPSTPVSGASALPGD